MDQPSLYTRRLVLRPFTSSDAVAVQELAGAREIADTTLHIPHPYPDGAAEEWIATHAPAWQAGTLATYAICHGGGTELIGAIGLTIAPEHARAELGYWVGRPYWSRGYCTEAAQALLAFGFDVLRLHRIQAQYLTRNPASGRVMQKLGMQLEGLHRDAVRKWDRFEDLAMCAILASDWTARAHAASAPAPRVARAPVLLERQRVSRKTPLDGKLEISPAVTARIEALGAVFPVWALGREESARLESLECKCAKVGGEQHVHHFVVSSLLRGLAPGSEIRVELDEARGALRLEQSDQVPP